MRRPAARRGLGSIVTLARARARPPGTVSSSVPDRRIGGPIKNQQRSLRQGRLGRASRPRPRTLKQKALWVNGSGLLDLVKKCIIVHHKRPKIGQRVPMAGEKHGDEIASSQAARAFIDFQPPIRSDYRHESWRCEGEVATLTMGRRRERRACRGLSIKLNSYDSAVDHRLCRSGGNAAFEAPGVQGGVAALGKNGCSAPAPKHQHAGRRHPRPQGQFCKFRPNEHRNGLGGFIREFRPAFPQQSATAPRPAAGLSWRWPPITSCSPTTAAADSGAAGSADGWRYARHQAV